MRGLTPAYVFQSLKLGECDEKAPMKSIDATLNACASREF